jgi:hypothetical protein
MGCGRQKETPFSWLLILWPPHIEESLGTVAVWRLVASVDTLDRLGHIFYTGVVW